MVCVIFVEPESPGNIGSIARCMKNFGAHPLILVNPCSLRGAERMAMHAQDILDAAVISPSLRDALALVDTSVATTSKSEGPLRNALTPRELKSLSTERAAIVIGRESSGLTNDEIELCDLVVSIPTCSEYPAMNAASACCIVLYELFSERKEIKSETPYQQKKIAEEVEKIADLIERRSHRKRIWKIVTRRIVSKAFLTDRETTVLLGFFKRIRTVLEATPLQKR